MQRRGKFDAGVPFIYRLDGSLFNIRQLTTETKVSHERVFELQYADNAALPAHSATTLQDSLDVLSSAYNRAGLIMSMLRRPLSRVPYYQS